MTDGIILECEGKVFSASKNALSSVSPYFVAMFHSSFQEARSGKVHLEGVTADALNDIICYASTGLLPDTNGDLSHCIELFEASHLLQLEILVHQCLHTISKNATLTNFLEFWSIAKLYDCVGLGAKIETLVANNFDEASQNPDFLRLSIDQVKELVQHPELKVSSGKTLIGAINRWTAFEALTREPFLADVISLINDSLCQKCQNVPSHLNGSHEEGPASFGIKENFSASLHCFIEHQQECFLSTFYLGTKEWSTSQSLPFRLEHGMTVLNYGKYVYFIGGGGIGPIIQPSTVVYKYCISTNSVYSTGLLKRAVGYAGAGTLNGWLYVVNGLSMEKRAVHFTQRYNECTDTCQEIACTNEGHVRPHVFSYGDYLYVVGSKTNAERSIEQLDSLTDQWTTIGGIPGSISWCRCARIEHKLFVIRRGTEKKMLMFDLTRCAWEEIDFEGGPRHILGMWSPPSRGPSSSWTLLVRSEGGAIFVYRSDHETWEQISEEQPAISECKWFQSVVVFK